MHYPLKPARTFEHSGNEFDTRALTGPEEPVSRPVLLAVDGDEEALRGISRELHKRYGDDYRVVCDRSPESALERLRGSRRRATRWPSCSPTSGCRG